MNADYNNGLGSGSVIYGKCPFCARDAIVAQVGGRLIAQCSNEECRDAANPIAVNEEAKIEALRRMEWNAPCLGAYPLVLQFDSVHERERWAKRFQESREALGI